MWEVSEVPGHGLGDLYMLLMMIGLFLYKISRQMFSKTLVVDCGID